MNDLVAAATTLFVLGLVLTLAGLLGIALSKVYEDEDKDED